MTGLSQSGTQTTVASPAASVALSEPLVAALYDAAHAQKWGLGREEFSRVLGGVCGKYLRAGAAAAEVRTFCEGLRIEELALARACAAGLEPAWTEFLTRFREKLYDAARIIAKDDVTGHELADSIYADLYGMSEREGVRVSKLEYYTGRGSLEGWLRTVLAQEFVNRYRKGKRNVSLEEQEEAGAQFMAPQAAASAAVDPRLEAAVDAALAGLDAESRYLVASYYLDGRKLADIGRTLGVHESTISRKLEKVVKQLHKQLLTELRRSGMSDAQAKEALETDVRDLSVNLRAGLEKKSPAGGARGVQESPPTSFYKKEEV